MFLHYPAPQNGGNGDGIIPAISSGYSRVGDRRFYGVGAQFLRCLARVFCSSTIVPTAPSAILSMTCRPSEGVFAVKQRAAVERREIILGVVAGEGRTAQQDGNVDASGVHLFEVFPHDGDGFDEQA